MKYMKLYEDKIDWKEDWEEEDDIVDEEFYYVQCNHYQNTINVLELKCRGYSKHGYYEFSDLSNKIINTILYPKDIHIVKKIEYVTNEEFSYLIDHDNEELFKDVFYKLFELWRENLINKKEEEIQGVKTIIDRLKKINGDEHLKKIMRSKE